MRPWRAEQVDVSNIQNDLSANLNAINAKVRYEDLSKGASGHTSSSDPVAPRKPRWRP